MDILKTFKLGTLELFKPARLVWEEKAPEAAPAAAEAEPAKPKTSPPAAAERPDPKAAAEKAAKVTAAGDAEQQEAKAAADALLLEDADRQTLTDFDKKYVEIMKEKDPEKAAKALVDHLLTLKPEKITAITTSFEAPVTEKEKTDFTAKHKNADGSLNLDAVGKAIDEGTLSPREMTILSDILKNQQNPDAKNAEIIQKAAETLAKLTQALEFQKVGLSFREVNRVIEANKDAYKKYLGDHDKEAFLKSITIDADREIMQRAIEKKPSEQEKAYVEKYTTLKDDHKTPKELAEALAKEELGYRESVVGISLITTEDIDKWKKENPPRIDETQEKELRDQLAAWAEQEAQPSEDGGDLRKLGLGGLIERLIDKITALIEKLTGQLSNMFKPKEAEVTPFKTSPIEKNGHFTVVGYDETKGLTLRAEGPNKKVTSVTDGKIKEVDRENNTVTVEVDKNTIIYSGFKSIPVSITKDAPIKEGDELGTLKDDTLTIKTLNGEGKSKDPTDLLKTFIKPADKPATTPADTPAAPADKGAAAPATPPKPDAKTEPAAPPKPEAKPGGTTTTTTQPAAAQPSKAKK